MVSITPQNAPAERLCPERVEVFLFCQISTCIFIFQTTLFPVHATNTTPENTKYVSKIRQPPIAKFLETLQLKKSSVLFRKIRQNLPITLRIKSIRQTNLIPSEFDFLTGHHSDLKIIRVQSLKNLPPNKLFKLF